MGEKIKDLNPITIGNTSLMIELNEGYTQKEGRLIHIQNPHFRYLINQQGFVELAATVLRAKDELYYYKEANRCSREYTSKAVNDFENHSILCLIDMLKNEGIIFRIVEKTNRLVNIIINKECINAFHLFAKRTLIKEIHPHSRKYGYTYLYQMHEFEMYSFEGAFLEVYYEMPSASLTPYMWMPLDKMIQKRVWDKPGDDLDDLVYLVYKLSYCIFYKHGISEKDIHIIKRKSSALCESNAAEYVSTVFFKYTNRLIEKIKQEDYSDLISDYFSFTDY